MRGNLQEDLNWRLAELLDELEQEQNKPGSLRMNSVGMQLRSLRNLCPPPGTDLMGEVRMSQAQNIQRDLERDNTMPENLRLKICAWLGDYACMVL